MLLLVQFNVMLTQQLNCSQSIPREDSMQILIGNLSRKTTKLKSLIHRSCFNCMALRSHTEKWLDQQMQPKMIVHLFSYCTQSKKYIRICRLVVCRRLRYQGFGTDSISLTNNFESIGVRSLDFLYNESTVALVNNLAMWTGTFKTASFQMFRSQVYQ